jgi:uncharacterized protein DUF5994
MTLITDRHLTTVSTSPPSIPRMRLNVGGSLRTPLDGGWWPRSTDPVAELPGLALRIDRVRGPVLRLLLSAAGWSTHPRRLGLNDRVLRLGYFTSQSTLLLIAVCGYNGERVDLLVVPPDTGAEVAAAAMALAASNSNCLRAEDILGAVAALAGDPDAGPEDVWETDGGRVSTRDTRV